MNPLLHEHDWCAFFDAHRDNRCPTRMHAKTERRLFRLSHCESLLRRRAFHNLSHYFTCAAFRLPAKTKIVFRPFAFSNRA